MVESTTSTRVFMALLVLGLMFQNCANPPQMNADIVNEIPSKWKTPFPPQELITGPWWQVFGDSLFNHHFELFQKNSPNLQSLIYQMDMARQSATLNGAGIFPTVISSGTGSGNKQNLSAFGFSGSLFGSDNVSQDSTSVNTSSTAVSSFESENYNLNLSVQWEVDIWGKLLNERRAIFTDYISTKNELIYLQFSLSAQFSNAYFSAVESSLQFQLAEEITQSLSDIRNIVQDRYQKGLATSLDLRLAESSLALSKVQLENKNIQQSNAIRMVEIFMGKYPSATLKVSSTLPELFPNTPAGLPSTIIQRRPDIQSALQKVEAMGFRVAQAKRNLLPGLTLTASGGTSTSDLKDILNGDYSVWNLGANLTAPVFQGGRLRANLALSKSNFSLAEQEAIKSILTAFGEVEQGLSADASTQRQFLAITDAVIQAEAAYTLALDRYENGLTDLITVLNSQQQWADTKSTKIAIQNIRLNTRINLLLALGGDFAVNNHE